MVDYREVLHGRDLLASFFRDGAKVKSFTDAVDAIAPKAAGEALNHFERSLSEFFSKPTSHRCRSMMIAKIHMGGFPCGRAFGGATARVALVIRIPNTRQ